MSAAAIETRPYIGLRYFEEHDAHLFYGRDEHVAELLGKLAENRFVAVMGSSGCGKSSLVRAGLLPELRSGMIPKAGPRWKVVEFKPGRAPLGELSDAIRSKLSVEKARELVEEGPLGIARAVAEANLDEGTNVLIIADQFEELFRFQREESSQGRGPEAVEQCRALVRRLLDAAAQPELPIYVLLVVRSDYLGECAQFPDLPERMSGSLYLVPRLRRDQLQEAITAPVGGDIEPAVVQRLLSEVGNDPDQLPRLQHLLGRMWDRARGGRLTMDHYKGVDGWEKGLEQHLEEVYKRLGPVQQWVCRRVFQQLSELDKGRAVRRRAEIEDLERVCGPKAATVVEEFRREGFVLPQSSPVDITHECVLRGWGRLREWLADEERARVFYRELVERKDRPGRLHASDLREVGQRRRAGQFNENWARRYGTDDEFVAVEAYVRRSRRTRNAARLGVGLLVAAVAAMGVYTVWSSQQQKRQSARAGIDGLCRAVAIRGPGAGAVSRVAGRGNGPAAAAGAGASSGNRADEWSKLCGLAGSRCRGVRRCLEPGWEDAGLGECATERSGCGSFPAVKHCRTLQGHKEGVNSVAWSPDGKTLVSAGADGTVRLWEAASGQPLRTLQGHQDSVKSVAWSPDGKTLASASDDRTIRLWEAASGQPLRTLQGHQDLVVERGLEPGREDASVREFRQDDPAVGGGQRSTAPHSARPSDIVFSVAWSPDGKTLASASADGRSGCGRRPAVNRSALCKVIKADVLQRGLEPGWQDAGVREFRPDDPAVGGGQRSTAPHSARSSRWSWRAWPGARMARRWRPRVSTGRSGCGRRPAVNRSALCKVIKTDVMSVAWSPDGKTLASASYDTTIRLWEAASGQPLRTLQGHQDPVRSVAWSPDGKTLASASRDRTIRLWEAASGQPLRTLQGHQDSVTQRGLEPGWEDAGLREFRPDDPAVGGGQRSTAPHSARSSGFCEQRGLEPGWEDAGLGESATRRSGCGRWPAVNRSALCKVIKMV